MLDGFLSSLLCDTEKGKLLRDRFVFKIIPVLNPDGVYRGHYRLDSRGFNLNRCYIYPSQDEFPVVYATKAYIDYLHSERSFLFYMDLHAQPSRPSSFLFGNSQSLESQTESQLFAKLLSLLTPLFTYSYCDFSERSMRLRDPKDHQSKEGCGRVAVYRSTGLAHCYTIECCYEAGRCLAAKTARKQSSGFVSVSDIPAYLAIGEALSDALLAYYCHKPLLDQSLSAVRDSVHEQVALDKAKPRMTRKSSYRQKSKEDLKKTEKGRPSRTKQTPRAMQTGKVASPEVKQEKVAKLPPIAPRHPQPPKSKRMMSTEGKARKRLLT